jgi:hypothetical protein
LKYRSPFYSSRYFKQTNHTLSQAIVATAEVAVVLIKSQRFYEKIVEEIEGSTLLAFLFLFLGGGVKAS